MIFVEDSLDDFPVGSEDSIDDDAFEALMGVSTSFDDPIEDPALPTSPGTDPRDPSNFETLPTDPVYLDQVAALYEKTDPPKAGSSRAMTLTEVDDRITFLRRPACKTKCILKH